MAVAQAVSDANQAQDGALSLSKQIMWGSDLKLQHTNSRGGKSSDASSYNLITWRKVAGKIIYSPKENSELTFSVINLDFREHRRAEVWGVIKNLIV